MSICPPFLSQRNKEQEKILQEQSNTEIDKPTIDKWNWFSPTVPILLTTICFMIMGILICFEKLPDCSLVELSPVMKFSTRANTSDKCIDLTWSQPLNVKIKKYEIQYTCGVWKNFQSLDAYPPNLSEQIFDIIPKKEYRFRACYIYSCHSEDIRSDLSEDQIYSDEPAMPGKMPPVWKDGKIILFWSPPADTLFATTNYGIQITIDEWATMIADLEQPAKLGLKYNVENIKKSEMYRFKIYTSTKFGMSKPVDNFFYTGVCYSIGIPIGQNYNDALNNRDSVEYNEKSNAVHSAIEDTYQSELGKGEQKVKDVSFVENSRIAVVIFISNGYYDEVKLREVIENSVKSGTLGDLKTFYEGFSFTVLNKPEPPQDIRIVVEKSCVVLMWAKPEKSLFEKESYIIEYTTCTSDVWQTIKVEHKPDDMYAVKITDVLPSSKYKFRLSTIIHDSIASHQSTENEITMGAPLPPRNISVVQNNAGIELFWEHPHTIQLHCIQHYTIYIKEDGVHPLKPVIVLSPQRSQLIVNLKPKHRYTFKVSTCSTGNFEGEVSVLIESTSGDTTVGSQ
ncbi:uncharacterized protein LOC127699802 isoform X2 [Mytilus californianus]|uniref:uncharacterized protein LOC127699802 isoform X2 n=1 Tax=Mytilus californianus TaxID=6549 RepID=UPI00224677F2|nr:uncharacterized protein LOC127699802 isoform X2 [Mytilus californianus]